MKQQSREEERTLMIFEKRQRCVRVRAHICLSVSSMQAFRVFTPLTTWLKVLLKIWSCKVSEDVGIRFYSTGQGDSEPLLGRVDRPGPLFNIHSCHVYPKRPSEKMKAVHRLSSFYGVCTAWWQARLASLGGLIQFCHVHPLRVETKYFDNTDICCWLQRGPSGQLRPKRGEFYFLREFYNLRKSEISEVILVHSLTHSLAVGLMWRDKDTNSVRRPTWCSGPSCLLMAVHGRGNFLQHGPLRWASALPSHPLWEICILGSQAL